uniref:Uncharacterized protein n=1 Tax=Bionectria ochroleuca TaxID=29856 RepID=A0A8H7K5M8_BIOOC
MSDVHLDRPTDNEATDDNSAGANADLNNVAQFHKEGDDANSDCAKRWNTGGQNSDTLLFRF